MTGEALPSVEGSDPNSNGNGAPSGFRVTAAELAAILFCGLALSVGWGVRGNWGHEFGAMIPGALAAMAAAISLGRTDWHRRVAYFGFFGALGWSFGGSISYMWVIGYAHSGHAPSVLYGFACLFVIGFLWGSLGGLGTALPATLERERLTQLLAPSCAVFVAWILQAILMEVGEQDEAVLVRDYGEAAAHFLQTLNYNWYDTDWVATLSAAGALLLFAAIRRRCDWATCFLLVLAAGWWIGFTLLTTALGLRMTPNRGDSWAGVLGMVAAAFIWLVACRMYALAWSTLVAGLIGGLGFSGAAFIQLLELTSGYKTNWHSVLEQTYGLINGVGIGIAMVYLARRTPRVTDAQGERPWTDTFCVLFVLLGITWLNIRKNLPTMWLKEKTIPEEMYGLSATTWFTLAYLLLALAVVVPLIWHRRVRRIAIVPDSWLGKGQMLFLVFLWWIIVGNLSRYLPFNPLRMITEGTIHLNACLLTLLALLLPTVACGVPYGGVWDWPRTLKRTLILGGAACALVILLEFAVTRVVWGDKFSGHGMRHIRFGPDSTTGKYKP